ncbi:FMN-dependent NADH-azoreductase [Paenibacillus psychroresistens]|uniref:FMN dependent NADH:quinone oxidoreductase n=1 Tax=Paenibacillus psychroresistens TaxID=1778678 RepID=A0A6B8RUF7_9BACL|nr:FMN-dependent NADH-azoreductase [Paenibacillus psychroresistens]QGQ99587.1 FMN-dependent NADH-azoreductase [Paenibacillus psychroresistens]
MATVLYITAHPLDHSTSLSLAVGKEFIEAYQKQNPSDEIVTLDLYNIDIPLIDNDVFTGWGKLSTGTAFDQLSDTEKAKVSRLGQIVDQFVAADKYVIVNPMWNFSFPPVLKAYIDAVCVAGKTFSYTATGPVGLLGSKKALHIQASGGVYSEGPAAGFEHGHKYLQTIAAFTGIPTLEAIFIEGAAAAPDQAPAIKAKAIEKALELALRF